MIIRSIYALRMAWRHRAALKAYQKDPLQVKTVLALNLIQFKQQGIKAIALDFDGVLAPHGEVELSQDIVKFLNINLELFGAGNVFVLTNQPTASRHAHFREHFKGIEFVCVKQKKPYPEGILQILQMAKIKPSELLVLDDRLLTGILAAIIVGASGRYVISPFISFRHRPFQEWFFIGLRKLERWIIRVMPG